MSWEHGGHSGFAAGGAAGLSRVHSGHLWLTLGGRFLVLNDRVRVID